MITRSSSEARFLVLAGQAPIHEFVRFVRTRAIGGQRMEELALTREWQRANAYVRELESTEEHFADVGELEPLPRSIAAAADKEMQDPLTQRCLSFLPHRWAMVELDRLIVWQKYVDLGFTEGLTESLPLCPDAEDLLRVAIGRNRAAPTMQVTALGSNVFSFSSPSSDLRVLGAVPLDPAAVAGYKPYGHAAAVLAVFIGYGINVMWAIQMGNRLMLVNGTHRAYGLRAHGVTHAPCLISRISSRDDFELAGLPDSKESSGSYFARTRPPLLKDYFDERLFKVISVARDNHIVQLELKFERTRSPLHPQ